MSKVVFLKETMPTMAGMVEFHFTPCPYGMNGFMNSGKIAMVGSSDCQMCPYFGEIEGDKVNCKHT